MIYIWTTWTFINSFSIWINLLYLKPTIVFLIVLYKKCIQIVLLLLLYVITYFFILISIDNIKVFIDRQVKLVYPCGLIHLFGWLIKGSVTLTYRQNLLVIFIDRYTIMSNTTFESKSDGNGQIFECGDINNHSTRYCKLFLFIYLFKIFCFFSFYSNEISVSNQYEIKHSHSNHGFHGV
jgi:hypothetical protein